MKVMKIHVWPKPMQLEPEVAASNALISGTACSPSPRPSPLGGGGNDVSFSTFPGMPASPKRCRQFSLSPRERIPRRDSRFAPLNRPLSGLRHPLPLRGGKGKGEGAVHSQGGLMGRELAPVINWLR